MQMKLFLSLLFLVNFFKTVAQSNPIPQTLPYLQNFSSLTHSATSYPAGWMGWTIATSSSTSYNSSAPIGDRVLIANSSASTNTGNVHNYNGKIGILNTASLDLGIVLSLNTLGKKNILLNYDALTLRNPYDSASNTRIRGLALQYRIDTIGAFVTIPSTEYQNNMVKQTTSGVTTAQNTVLKTVLLPSVCDSQSIVQIRWVTRDVSGSGLRPSLAIDNIQIDTASIVTPKFVAHTIEGSASSVGKMNIVLSSATTLATSFNYSISGSATLGIDYTITVAGIPLSSATGTIPLAVGTSLIPIECTTINDALQEGMETIKFTLNSAPSKYALIDSSVVINIVDDELTPIHQIQGKAALADSATHFIEGIVTGVYHLMSPIGFYVQEEDADADSDISSAEGIYVVSDSSVSIGDKIRILGDTYEGSLAPSYGLATIVPKQISIISKGNPMPSSSVIHLPLVSRDELEHYEGMLVRFNDTLSVTDNSNLGKYGEISLSQGGIIYQPTQVVDPNDIIASGVSASGTANKASIDSVLRSNDLRTVLLDDGRSYSMPTLPYVNSDNTLRVGSSIDSLWGIMSFAFDAYRLQPVSLSAIKINHQKRPDVPNVGSDATIKVASFNVLNYFNGDGLGGGFPTSRGAHSIAEFTRQRDKIIKAIIALNADIVGLIEIENDGTKSHSAIQNLADGINAYLGSGTYSILHDGDTIQQYNTDEIRCAIIYKANILDTIGGVMLGSDSVFNRPPVAQTFRVKSSDSVFNFVINHFKAKGCASSKGLDKDQADGQSCYNETRRRQADALVKFINNDVIKRSKSDKVLSMGDYNAYYEEDPLDTIRSKGFIVLSKFDSYSYLYQGQLGSLDNAFVSSSFLPFITGVEKWNINSVEPSYLDYEDDIDDGGSDQTNFWSFLYSDVPYRCSDHDPVLIGLRLGEKLKVENTIKERDYFIYPNPSDGNFIISCSGILNQSIHATIYDLLGRVVHHSTLSFLSHKELLKADVEKGMYILELKDKDGICLRQQIIIH